MTIVIFLNVIHSYEPEEKGITHFCGRFSISQGLDQGDISNTEEKLY